MKLPRDVSGNELVTDVTQPSGFFVSLRLCGKKLSHNDTRSRSFTKKNASMSNFNQVIII